MLPTQFIPEYYRDSKDIVNADDMLEDKHEESRPRRSLLAFVLGLLRRSRRETHEGGEVPQGQLAHR
jgi:hypothetical protein